MTEAIRNLESESTLDEALSEGTALIYKHSSRCPLSAGVLCDVRRFAETRWDIPVYKVPVIEQRGLSNRIADRLGVDHESPQVILVMNGRAVWHASHDDISVAALDEAARKFAGAV